MAVFEDPIRALRVELPLGFAFDPFTSTLTDFYFGRWNSAEEIVVAYVEPARVTSNQGDQVWLARIDDETTARTALIDLWSHGGRAVAAEFHAPGGSVQRVAYVRGPRVDFAIEHTGGDQSAADPWRTLSRAARTIDSAANTNPGTPSAASEIVRVAQAADRAVKQGEMAAAIDLFRGAVWMGTATWLNTLWGPLNLNHVFTALQLAGILGRLGQVVRQPGILRDAEYIARRAERSLKEMGAETFAKFEPEIRETLNYIYKELHRQVDPDYTGPFSRIRALSTRAMWLASGAETAYGAGNLEECKALAAAAVDDLLTISVQKERGLAQSPVEVAALNRDSEFHWAAETVKTLHVQHGCAMALQDSALAIEASALLASVAERLVEFGAGRKGIDLVQANVLMAQAGTFLFLGEDSLTESGRYLEAAERILDAAGEEGPVRAQLCLNIGWNRFYRKQIDGLLGVADRGLAAAKVGAPVRLVGSLHALRAQLLVTAGRADEGIVEANVAITGSDPPLSTHVLIRAVAKFNAGERRGALEDVRLALKFAFADNPLGEDVPLILFAASTYAEPLDVPVSLELTWAAQTVMDARRLALRETDERIAFDDAVRHREVAQTLVTRLIEAEQYAAALEAADRSRARSFNQLLGRPWQDPVARPDREGLTLDVTSDPLADLHVAAGLVRQYADRTLEFTGLQPALSFDEMFGLVAGLGATSLVLQPVAGQIHIFLLRPPAGLVIAKSTIPSQAVAEALDRLQAELGVFALARARSGGTPPLADVETDREALADAIQSVSDALLKPLAPAFDLLRRGESLIVVSYRELSLIPYSLLLLPDGTPLVERVAVSLVPSLATLSLVRREVQGEERGGCLIVGNPAVDSLSGLQPLPAAAWEAREVRDLLLAAGVREDRIALRLDEQASEPEYRASARHCRLVHLACHAAVREPVARSALYLSPGPHDDGQLLPAEIAEIRLSGSLVFLSACQTGLGRPTADGVIGLSRAFLEAGARCVVMSMWKVADEAAAHLASQFYRNWLGLNGPAKTAAHALQAAMLATRADLAAGKVVTSRNEVLDDHPAHWAPFLLLGDGGMTFHD